MYENESAITSELILLYPGLFESSVSLLPEQVTEQQQDSTLKDSIAAPREALTDIVKYSATDYSTFDRRENKLYLYNEAKVAYTDITITAGQIIVDNNTNTVFAKGITDSTGYNQPPVFVQGPNTVEPDSIKYNFKSILDNPQLLQEMIRANPQMNQVMEQNPDLARVHQ